MAKKMTEQEKQEWDELYQYIKKEILQYKDKNIPKGFILRLVGLHDGKFMANKKTKPLAHYTYKQILFTFKIHKFDILNGLNQNKYKFKDESHKINYIMVIIEKNINDVVDRMNKVNKSKIKGANVDINIDNDKAEYTKKTKEIKSKVLQDLW